MIERLQIGDKKLNGCVAVADVGNSVGASTWSDLVTVELADACLFDRLDQWILDLIQAAFLADDRGDVQQDSVSTSAYCPVDALTSTASQRQLQIEAVGRGGADVVIADPRLRLVGERNLGAWLTRNGKSAMTGPSRRRKTR